jgi:hypothetical protein
MTVPMLVAALFLSLLVGCNSPTRPDPAPRSQSTTTPPGPVEPTPSVPVIPRPPGPVVPAPPVPAPPLPAPPLPAPPLPAPPLPAPPVPSPPVPGPPGLAGNYTVTLTAANCTSNFPSEFVSRSYRSHLDLSATSAVLEIFQIDGGTMVNPAFRGTFAAPDQLTLTSYLGNDQYEGLFEQVTPTNLVSVLVDEMRVTASPLGMSGTFAGAFLLYSGRQGHWPEVVAKCLSTQHTVNLTR